MLNGLQTKEIFTEATVVTPSNKSGIFNQRHGGPFNQFRPHLAFLARSQVYSREIAQ